MEVECNIADGFICIIGKGHLKAVRNNEQQKGATVLNTIIDGLGGVSAKASSSKLSSTTLSNSITPNTVCTSRFGITKL